MREDFLTGGLPNRDFQSHTAARREHKHITRRGLHATFPVSGASEDDQKTAVALGIECSDRKGEGTILRTLPALLAGFRRLVLWPLGWRFGCSSRFW